MDAGNKSVKKQDVPCSIKSERKRNRLSLTDNKNDGNSNI